MKPKESKRDIFIIVAFLLIITFVVNCAKNDGEKAEKTAELEQQLVNHEVISTDFGNEIIEDESRKPTVIMVVAIIIMVIIISLVYQGSVQEPDDIKKIEEN